MSEDTQHREDTAPLESGGHAAEVKMEEIQDQEYEAPLESEGDVGEVKMEEMQDREYAAPLESEGDADKLKMEEAEDPQNPKKERPKAQGTGEILEGKRTKKTVERLDFQISIPQEKLKVVNAGGDKLGDIPRTSYHISKMKHIDLKPLHMILFDRPGKISTLKKNMRLFNGFTFEVDSEPYTRKRQKMLRNRNSTFSKPKLRVICRVLDLEQKGGSPELIDRILAFLMSPRSSGKPPKKKKTRKNPFAGFQGFPGFAVANTKKAKKTTKKRKPKRRSTSSPASPKKAKSGSKSKAIVMDLSSDDDDNDQEGEKTEVTLDGVDSDSEKKPMEDKEKSSDSDDLEEDEAESPKPKGKGSLSKKSTPAKRQRAPVKKTDPPKKKVKRELSDQSEAETDSEPEETPKKKTAAKKATPAKPAAKTKKADSSSNRKKTTSTVDSSDDDEPLIKMIKKEPGPSDEQLKETVQELLKEADLEEMTMKQICQKVYDTYPDHDLTSRKDYIKQTVKMLIT